jgi:hypothetical protein
VHYVITTIDARGRVSDRSPLRALQWPPGLPIVMSAVPGVVLVVAQAGGGDAVTRQGHLRLRADTRRRCRVGAGDRLLLAAYRDRGLLMAFAMPVVDEMVHAYHVKLANEAVP